MKEYLPTGKRTIKLSKAEDQTGMTENRFFSFVAQFLFAFNSKCHKNINLKLGKHKIKGEY